MNRTETNDFNNLLQSLSHVGEIRTTTFKAPVNRVTGTQPSLRHTTTYLQILAPSVHLDDNPTNVSHANPVVSAPAVFVETAVAERYVLVGSRTPNLLKALQTCVSEVGGEVQSLDSPYAPTTTHLNGLSDRTLSAIETLDIHPRSVQFQRGSQTSSRCQNAPVSKKTTLRFSTHKTKLTRAP